MLKYLKSGCIVCNIEHFDTEIDTSFMREAWEWELIKPQIHKIRQSQQPDDAIILLSEGRLVNLDDTT